MIKYLLPIAFVLVLSSGPAGAAMLGYKRQYPNGLPPPPPEVGTQSGTTNPPPQTPVKPHHRKKNAVPGG